ncbi:4Fe-4S dicluster domain-containing protein [Rhizobium sp. RU20A]|uniref:4Fe-4S dicluster domain-containing protein n=1 Tax=Rhizobium sp. RU20A TaxID=1907412 RepID=UPI00122CAA57|nr:4Fe-4S dicluster domain-containing protein [Rhizobium sp. RU20A]
MDRGDARPRLDRIVEDLAPHGLFPRGVVVFDESDARPALADGRPAASVVLVGAIGGSFWAAFAAWRQTAAGGGGDPLDTWSKAVITPVAGQHGATVFFPSDPPYQPFQRWAMRAEGVQASPLGILMHPQYGLWHSYRGALAFPEVIEAQAAEVEPHPCDACRTHPCLSSCPVGAITERGFAVQTCRSHLVTPAGQAGCMVDGCAARNACPVGKAYRYSADQLRFHMAALKL